MQRILRSSILLAGLASFAASAATPYTVDPDKSTLGFTAIQSDAEFEGSFRKFQAKIVFSADDLPGSRFEVVVDTASADTGDEDRDTALRGPDLFSVEKYPQARFVSTSFSRKAAGSYEAVGKLTIRDVTREIRVPFTFKPAGQGAASLTGGANLKRLDFGVGQGEWKDTVWVGNDIKVKFALRLVPAAPAR